MEVLFIVILIICIGVVFTVGLLFKLLPYIVCIGLAIIVIGLVIKGIGLVIKGIHSLFLYLHEALGNLYQSVKINCAQKKIQKAH